MDAKIYSCQNFGKATFGTKPSKLCMRAIIKIGLMVPLGAIWKKEKKEITGNHQKERDGRGMCYTELVNQDQYSSWKVIARGAAICASTTNSNQITLSDVTRGNPCVLIYGDNMHPKFYIWD